MKKYLSSFILITIVTVTGCQSNMKNITYKKIIADNVFERVRSHEFNPLNEENSMTMDRTLKVAGIADLDNDDWKVRLLAVSDLEQVVNTDKNSMVRSQAVIALGQIESTQSLDLLRKKLKEDPSRDVQHQCELAIYQIEKHMGTTDKQLSSFLSLDESTFKTVKEGSAASDFILEDTEGKEWQLSSFRNKNWVVLIWIFADWCPVCHGEFNDLMEMKEEFTKAGVQVFTIEMHDRYRGRVMVGKEVEPDYWFSKKSFKEAYTSKIFWPHLLDRAGAIAAKYGADPLAFSVHSEYINRPTTVIIDKEGIVRFSYKGTFWGDRPTIEKTLKMIETGDFSFEHPQRRKL